MDCERICSRQASRPAPARDWRGYLRITVLLIVAGLGTGQAAGPAVSWTNPLVLQRADPHVTCHDGQYLMTATVPKYDLLELRRASRSMAFATPLLT